MVWINWINPSIDPNSVNIMAKLLIIWFDDGLGNYLKCLVVFVNKIRNISVTSVSCYVWDGMKIN